MNVKILLAVGYSAIEVSVIRSRTFHRDAQPEVLAAQSEGQGSRYDSGSLLFEYLRYGGSRCKAHGETIVKVMEETFLK